MARKEENSIHIEYHRFFSTLDAERSSHKGCECVQVVVLHVFVSNTVLLSKFTSTVHRQLYSKNLTLKESIKEVVALVFYVHVVES